MDFNFTSQICTTKEQSERLLDLGLKKETADMTYLNDKICAAPYNEMECPYDNLVKPAWSLHRLIEMLDIWYLELNFNEFNNAFELVISYFEERVKGGFINKKYLEE